MGAKVRTTVIGVRAGGRSCDCATVSHVVLVPFPSASSQARRGFLLDDQLVVVVLDRPAEHLSPSTIPMRAAKPSTACSARVFGGPALDGRKI